MSKQRLLRTQEEINGEVLIKDEGDESCWKETWPELKGLTPEGAKIVAQEIVDKWNRTLRPGEKRREVVKIVGVEE